MDGYYYVDEPRSGALNMAMDRRLAELADQHCCALLRVYQWAQPTLSLGYFQSHAERQSHPPSRAIDCVRRQSGGGAIVHHDDWTYALALPGERHRTGASTQLYDCIHDSLVTWLRQLGWCATKWEAGSQASLDRERTTTGYEVHAHGHDFLCFNRRSPGDIVVGGHKVLGSAQRRYENCILQHGSLLLRTSRHAPSLSGLLDLSPEPAALDGDGLRKGRECPAESDIAGMGSQLAAWIGRGVQAVFGIGLAEIDPQSEIRSEIRKANGGYFAEYSWTAKR